MMPKRPSTRLALLWAVFTGARWLAALAVREPRIFRDELLHWELAKAFAAHRPFLFFGTQIDYPAVLYPMVLSLVFHVADGVHAFVLAQLLNAALVSAVVFPTYALALEFGTPAAAFTAAALAALVPGGVYSSLIMQESLYYPLFVLACWLSYRVLARGGAGAALWCAAVLCLTYFTKPLGVLLVVSYAGALAVWSALELRRSGVQALVHRVFPLIVFGAALTVRHFIATAGAPSSASEVVLSRFYVEESHGPLLPPLAPMAGVLVALVAALGLGTGIAPFAAFVSGWRERCRNRDVLLFTVFAGLVIGIYGVAIARHTLVLNDAPKVLERYFFAVAPLLIVALVVLPPTRVSRVALMLMAVAMVLTIGPLGRMVVPRATDAPSLALPWTARRAVGSGTIVALAFGAIAAFVGLYAARARERGRQGAACIVVLLLALNIGWYATMYRQRHLDAVTRFAHLLERQIGQKERVAVVIADTSETLQRVALYSRFWLGERVVTYWPSAEPRPWYADLSGSPMEVATRARASYLVVRDGSVTCPNAQPLPWSPVDTSLHVTVLHVPEGGCGTT